MINRIYVASSWRNTRQPAVVSALRLEGYEVYDFRNPTAGSHGFAWSEIDANWRSWSPLQFSSLVTRHPAAARGFAFDKAALDWCDTCVLVLPSGRSAHLEAGYAAGQGKRVVVLLADEGFEPELMYLLCDSLCHSIGDVIYYLRTSRPHCTVTSGWDSVGGTIAARD